MSFNLAVILSESARCAPDHPVAVFDGGQLTYRQLDQASDRVAANLVAAGSNPAGRLQLPNIRGGGRWAIVPPHCMVRTASAATT